MNLKRARIVVAVIFILLVAMVGGAFYWVFNAATSDKSFLASCDTLVTNVAKDAEIDVDAAYEPCKESWERTKKPQYGYNFYRLKRIREQESDLELLKLVSEEDYAPAQFAYAGIFREAQDFDQAFYWYKKAATNGIQEAQVNVGWSYANGKGTEQNDVLANEWYKKAADNGSAAGLYNLAWMYQNRRGTKDESHDLLDKKAVAMYRAAVQSGFGFASLNLCNMYKQGRVAEPNPEEQQKCQ